MATTTKSTTPKNKSGQPKIDTPKPAGGAWPGAFAICGQIFQQIKKNPAPAIFFVVTYVVFGIASSLAQGKSYGAVGYRDYQDLLELVFLLALPTYGLALADRRNLSISQAMEFDPRKYLAIFLGFILFALAAIFSILLLIIPIIWVAAWFSLYEFPVIENGVNAVDALSESKRLTSQHKAKVWGIIGAIILLSLPEIALLFIPIVQYLAVGYSMLLSIISTGAAAALYRHLQTVEE
jgi:hypothetical protein